MNSIPSFNSITKLMGQDSARNSLSDSQRSQGGLDGSSKRTGSFPSLGSLSSLVKGMSGSQQSLGDSKRRGSSDKKRKEKRSKARKPKTTEMDPQDMIAMLESQATLDPQEAENLFQQIKTTKAKVHLVCDESEYFMAHK